ncbi:MAG: arabinose ABC transporter substrate-binding protein [Fimbriimonadales bacterium]
MRKFLIGVAALAAIAGCGGGGDTVAGEADKPKIGFLVKSATEVWFQQEWKFADQAAEELGFDLIKIPTPDAEKVMSALDNLAAQGADGVIICSPDVKLGPAIVAKCKSANLKLLSVDDRLVNADEQPMDVPHLGISAHKIGKMVGQAIVDEMKVRGWNMSEVGAIAVNLDELETARQRIDGATEVLVANGFDAGRVFKSPWKTQDIPGALDAANITLTQHSDIKKWVAFSSNDDGVLGVVRATEGRNISSSDVIGVGINGTSGVDDFKKPNPTGFFGSVLLSPRKHGYDTCKMMFEWVKNGVVPPKETWTSGILITRENYEAKMKEEGLL